MRTCPGCGGDGEVKYPEKIDGARLTVDSFSSRKRPELLHHEYLECRRCRSLFTRSIHGSLDLEAKYEKATFISKMESAYAARTYRRLLEKSRILPDESVLDVGCADGAFLLELHQRGIRNLAGVELSRESIEAADPMIRPTIVQGTVKSLPSDLNFNLISCFQTIEHVGDPDGFVTEIACRLAHNGIFAIACHNRNSLVNRSLGEQSPIFDIEHMQLFTPTGIKSLLERAGFSDVRVSPYANTYPLHYWMNLSPIPESFKDFVTTHRESTVLRIPVKLPVGNLLVSGVRK